MKICSHVSVPQRNDATNSGTQELKMRVPVKFLGLLALVSLPLSHPARLHAQDASQNACPRPQTGSVIREPKDLHSQNGVLEVELTIHSYVEPGGSTRYCYLTPESDEAPNLRVNPGDLLILKLKNQMTDSNAAPSPSATTSQGSPQHAHAAAAAKSDPCTSGAMTATSTNLHFHGLTIPPVCHQDEVMQTSIGPDDSPFEYRFRIPENEQPGLYWYHPHIHGFTKRQVLGGASGALIVEGIERANKVVAGLPERVLIVRDQDLINPNAPPSKSEPVLPKMMIDRDGDAMNTGTGFGKPAKDLSLNFVPVPYPDYPPATIEMKPEEQQLWRVLNASAITYLNLAVLFNRVPQELNLVAMDGVPLNASGEIGDFVSPQTHLALPPGARVEFIVKGPAVGVHALLVTRTVDTGPGGENDPNRALAIITAKDDAPEPQSKLSSSAKPLPPPSTPWLGSVVPVRVRRFFFSEKLLDPNDPSSATAFFITEDGKTPAAFDPTSRLPDITVKQGTVEDWIIENRSNELHAFHIHQLHFLLLEYSGVQVNEPFLRDTVNVPYYNGRALSYPSVHLRMDFRDPNIVGTFVYHCHLLEHEDGGMMGTIRVEPARQVNAPKAPISSAQVSHTKGKQ
jgi:FtsP/CotA-like multicopper oxidase with cupredoxin domain